MKKRIAALLALLLMLTAAGALAENEAELFCDAAERLLFNTNNVTLTGTAEFFLDGERFKSAGLTLVRDYENSLLQLDLSTPRRDGSGRPDRETGYTVIANGANLYVMEKFYPGLFKTGSNYTRSTVLRKSVQTELMMSLVRMLARQADLSGEGPVTAGPSEGGGRELRLRLGENVPETVNAVVNVLYQYIAKRYFETDYDLISERFMTPMENAMTVTQAILGSTKSVSLKEANVTAVRDAYGFPEQIGGEVSLGLFTGLNGTRTLDVRFRLDVSDQDESHVDRFDPADFGVTLMEGYTLPETKGGSVGEPDDGPDDGPGAQIRTGGEILTGEELTAALGAARAYCARAGFADEDRPFAVYRSDGLTYVDFFDAEDRPLLSLCMDEELRLMILHHEQNAFQEVNVDRYVFGDYPDEALVADAAERVLQATADFNPAVREKLENVHLEWWYETDGELWFGFLEDPLAQDWDGMSMTVRVLPEWRIEIFSCISNG